MYLIIGYVIVLAASIGTYAVHGSLLALWVPLEYVAIFGLMIGGFVASNGPKAIKATLGSLGSAVKGSKYNRALYVDLLAMMFEILAKVRKEGLMSIENDIENPDSSPIFSKYPSVTSDHHVVEFLCDYLRMMVGGNLNAFEIENLMDMEIETHHQEAHAAPHIVAKVADSVPAFGIVVAVMGVVNVMGSVGEPPAVLGKMIGGALVGTFLGILVSYGFVAPLASQIEQKVEEGGKIYQVMKVVLLASMNGYAPQVAVEFGRKVLYSTDRPTFIELEEEIKSRKG
ncbi:flagellar motor stator protein MotA [Azoarcus communis]|uniref:Flagellar motor stator protein MotA n=1 Tax=Parazoarcus communis SWub3 = DSM 12120 TaxID=1121029 RepID=A0A323UVR9_9RHOO|nr:flagellar motor stator protein MotA [Parazoarcus communis]NMG48388.1 flagellar motor stator protein MotA [Parazoarcus communis]NMG70584.1 flagellar motor stator protein MotA [Parazoarcus communis SWub3 = DSM 12120]PZA15760.1 flagellar motor stator protein MotA [Azoarcus communis] [Parazoarcus communis SWub3 = DSM 12120]